jgi:hypothetical protein
MNERDAENRTTIEKTKLSRDYYQRTRD